MSESCLGRDLSSMVGLSRVWLSLGLVVSLTAALLGLPSPAGAVAGYGDVGEGTWYTDAVQWSTDNGIADIAGPCFGPDTPVSRGETAVWIYNMENQPDAGDPHSFSDVTDASQNDAISWMANTGITTGTSPTTFAPDENLKRAQAAAFLHRLAGEPAAPPHSFVDVVTAWQQGGVSWMDHTGITTGTSPTTFAPEDTLTRAHLVTFLYRYQDEPDVTINTSTPHCDPTADMVEDPVDMVEDPVDMVEDPVDMVEDPADIDAVEDSIFVDGPRIYNDNLFVMPVEKGTYDPAAFYQHFEDEFDFLMFVPADPTFFDTEAAGWFSLARNDVQGINIATISQSGSFGSAGKLQGTITFKEIIEISNIASHEIMHRWAAFILPSKVSDGVHWLTFGNMGGVMDGGYFTTPFEEIVDLGDGQYSAEFLIGRGYSPLELYLAGFIPPEDVPEFWVAANGEWVEAPWDVDTDPRQPRRVVFAASEIKRYTIDDVIAAHGRRIPEASESQRQFRAAAILLIDEAHPTVDTELLDLVSAAVAWFSHPGVLESSEYWSENFYESTGGRATLIMDGLSQLQKRPQS